MSLNKMMLLIPQMMMLQMLQLVGKMMQLILQMILLIPQMIMLQLAGKMIQLIILMMGKMVNPKNKQLHLHPDVIYQIQNNNSQIVNTLIMMFPMVLAEMLTEEVFTLTGPVLQHPWIK